MGCPLGGRKKSVTTTSKTLIVAMTIWDSLALLWTLGWMKSRSEGRDRPRGPTSNGIMMHHLQQSTNHIVVDTHTTQ